jgi:hypothetical protein
LFHRNSPLSASMLCRKPVKQWGPLDPLCSQHLNCCGLFAVQWKWPCCGLASLLQECALLVLPVLTASILGLPFALPFVTLSLAAWLSCLAEQFIYMFSNNALGCRNATKSLSNIISLRLSRAWARIHAVPQLCVLPGVFIDNPCIDSA